MKTQFCISADGTRIAYDMSGSGPALILLHGGGDNRKNWHKAGYVKRLTDEFTVITIDIRGNGESDYRYEGSDFAIEKLTNDILCVADSCSVDNFAIWGFSFGGNIARYLGALTGGCRPRYSSACV